MMQIFRWPGVLALGVCLLGACFSPKEENEKAAAPEQLPPAYADLRNPLPSDPAVIEEGRKLFIANCASCHGNQADGNGPVAMALVRKPANFRDGSLLPKHTDAFLYWRISEGKPESPMPKWKGVLDERSRWQIVTYLRRLEAASAPPGTP